MKYFLFSLMVAILISCNNQNQSQNLDSENPIVQDDKTLSIPLILPASLESRRIEFTENVNAAKINIRTFSKKFGWEDLTKEEFMDSVMIFDNKGVFNKAILKLAGADTLMNLPDTYCAALENRTLISVTPEFYAKVYPEGIEEHSFEKLLTHEIAHRLHIRILNGEEEAMGPVWFYEGFAIYAANQFSESNIILSKEEMIQIMNEPERGSYLKYNYIFRHFVEKVPLKELILKAKNKNFNTDLILMLN